MKDATDNPEGNIGDTGTILEDFDDVINRQNSKENVSDVATEPFEERNVESPSVTSCGTVLDENTWKGIRTANLKNSVYEGLDPSVSSC